MRQCSVAWSLILALVGSLLLSSTAQAQSVLPVFRDRPIGDFDGDRSLHI